MNTLLFVLIIGELFISYMIVMAIVIPKTLSKQQIVVLHLEEASLIVLNEELHCRQIGFLCTPNRTAMCYKTSTGEIYQFVGERLL
jgi:hypothetical protein